MDQPTERIPAAPSAPAGSVAAPHVPQRPTPTADQVFPGDSEMARLMRAMDWSQTPLGPVETWPQPLRMTVNLCLSSRFPIVLWWGPELSVFYNDAYRPSLGASKHPALGKSGCEVWPEVWPTIGPLLEGVMANGASTLSEDQLLPLDRYGYLEEVYFTYAYTPIRLETGQVGGVFCTVTETTAKVRAERRMRAGRDLAAALVDVRTPEEVCERAAQVLASDAADLPFALLYLLDAGKHCARLAGSVGLEMGATLAPPSLELTRESGEGAPWPLEQVARTNQREEVSDLATRWGDETVHARRELTPHTAMVLPVTEPGQSSPSAILVAGVSPMRAPDDNYEGFFELLVSHLSAGLAAAHAYEEERRRAEALAAIDRAKTAFFSNVSHEFRTPLTLLLGPLEESLADADQPLPPRLRERLEVMRRNGLRLLKLVNTLLDFARIEAGRVQAVYEPIDLATYTAELASSFRSLIDKAGMQLIVDCPPLDGALRQPIYLDRSMWEKIVLNLLSNAFKFTFAGTITVALRAVGDGDAVELEVRDTGTGIPAAELPRLFERFHRVDGARARTHEGSGIGLALVQEVVHLHGGTIRAESTEGAGTIFFVRLPVGTAHLPAERVRPARSAAPLASSALSATPFVEEAGRWLPDSGPDGGPERWDGMGSGAAVAGMAWEDELDTQRRAKPARILVADDNADMRDYLRRLLGERYVVEAVANGAQALATIRRGPDALPDLVVADVMMPELDGFGLLRALRGDSSTAMLPVILLSARAGEEATIEGLQAGADDYLVKPFSAREVLNRVAGRLEIARTRAEATRRMDEFLGIAAHELRTPLTSITANVQLAMRQLRGISQPGAIDELDGEPNRLERSAMLLERTDRQLARLDRLVGDLVDVSRIQAGKLELRPEPCDLVEIVREAVREQQAAWPQRSIALSLPRRAPLSIYADADRIGQVVTNLLTNALKYSSDDRPVAVRVLAQRDSARVEVRDQGPGLTTEQQVHLFERFYRVPGIGQRSGSGVGLGLGLHICKTIVGRHSGQVGVKSAPGEGSMFWFTLPLVGSDRA